jgi:hypothetical protein
MADEITSKPTFSQCLVHEAKGAYISYFKWVLICVGGGVALLGLFILLMAIPYDILVYNIKLIPWWIYAGSLVLIPPFMYSVLECLRKRMSKYHVSNAGGILLVIAIICIMAAIAMVSVYILIVAVICLLTGFWFII